MQGRVLKTTGSWYTVMGEDEQLYKCTIRGKLRLKSSRSTNPVTVGDLVNIDIEGNENTGSISNVNPRKNYIIRRSSNLSRESHVIAANIDQAILVVTIEFPETKFEFIDRYLVTAEAYQIPAILIFNKVDLYKEHFNDKLQYYLSVYQPIYPCYEVSAKNGDNVDRFKELLQGKISLVSGNSGVGKSTLINKIEPSLKLKTTDISHYHLKGKHTTTFSEMFPLSNGGFVIDTPGIKGFGLIDINKRELFHFFPEIFREAANCQYNNCTHQHEPGCSVKAAVEKNEISESRYYSYLSILLDEDSKYRG